MGDYLTNHNEDPQKFLPLTPAVFHILMSLADQDLHGYGIMKEVERHSNGRVQLKPGTLYQAIKRLLIAGLILEADERADTKVSDERRRYYRLSNFGKKVMSEEAERLERLVNLARVKRILNPSKNMSSLHF